jgi:kumamolisin
VAPLWAGFVALCNQKLQTHLGCVNSTLYAANESTCFNEITSGNNGAYSAGPGWNPVCGLGTPRGAQLIQDAFAMQVSVEQQPSNVS